MSKSTTKSRGNNNPSSSKVTTPSPANAVKSQKPKSVNKSKTVNSKRSGIIEPQRNKTSIKVTTDRIDTAVKEKQQGRDQLTECISKFDRICASASPYWCRPSNPACYFSTSEIREIINHDHQKYGISLLNKDIENTVFSYSLYLRVFSLLLDEYSEIATLAFHKQVCSLGLLDVIDQLKDCADAFIQECDISKLPATSRAIAFPLLCDLQKNDLPESQRIYLQILRFGKRFAVANPFTSEKAFNELRNCNQKCRKAYHDSQLRTGALSYRRSHFRDELWASLSYRLAKTFKSYNRSKRKSEDVYSFIPSKNAVHDACTCRGCKELVFAKERGRIYTYDQLGMIGISPACEAPNCTVLGKEVYYPPKRVIDIVSVPKTAKTGRCIAPEDVVAGSDQMHIRYAMETGWKTLNPPETQASGVNYYNQSVNQYLAMLGSVDNSYATTDFHSCSDLIHIGFMDALPCDLRNDVSVTRPTHFRIDGKVEKSYIISFMGCGYTYSLMSAILEALVLEAIDLVHLFTGQRYSEYSIIGDDVIVETAVAQTFMDLASMLGLEPNQEKSFLDGKFRESCGGDYYCGSYLTTLYWPRKLLNVGKEHVTYDRFGSHETQTVDTLIALQHSLSVFSYKAAEMLGGVICAVWPNVTQDMHGGVQQSVWTVNPTVKIQVVPHTDGTSGSFACAKIGDYSVKERLLADGDPRVREHHSVTHVAHKNMGTTNKLQHAKKCHLIGDTLDMEYYRYLEYLRLGPHYEEPLLELLKVSKQRSLEDYFYYSEAKRF